MKEETFVATAQRLEEQARQKPFLYYRQIFLLAGLGYAYVFGVAILLLGSIGLFIWLMMVTKNVWLIKFAFIPFVLLLLIIKSFWVKFHMPKGVTVSRADAPELFRTIDEARIIAKSPHIDLVLLNEEFSCAVTQVPRLGIFGFNKNILILGMPLLEALSLSQFKAVLAHEMGHLSANHSKFAAWIYHLEIFWRQMYSNLSAHSELGPALLQRFTLWFFPIFDAHTLALRRMQEYAADRISADIVGAQAAAFALINTVIKSAYFDKAVLAQYFKQVESAGEPPAGIFLSLKNSLDRQTIAKDAVSLLESAWTQQELTGSHPPLCERIRALMPDSDLSDIAKLTQNAIESDALPSAAEILLGSSLITFRQRVEKYWHQVILDSWKIQHQLLQECKKEFAELAKIEAATKLSKEQIDEFASLSRMLEDIDVSIARHRQLLKNYPDEFALHRSLGFLLLEKKDDECLVHLNKAMQLHTSVAIECCTLLYEYLKTSDRLQQAEEYLKKAKEFEATWNQASSMLTRISPSDKFVEHQLSNKKLDGIRTILATQPYIREAFALRKIVPEIVGEYQNILFLTFGSPAWWFLRDVKLENKAINALAQCSVFGGFYVAPKYGGNIDTACKIIADACIYERHQFGHKENFVVLAQNFLRQNWIYIAGLILLAALIICGIYGGRQTPENVHQALVPARKHLYYQATQGGQIDFLPYMVSLQKHIKAHWLPPLQNQCGLAASVVKFQITRTGRLANLRLEKPSGIKASDEAALAAIKAAEPFTPLPEGSPQCIDIIFQFDFHNLSQNRGHSK